MKYLWSDKIIPIVQEKFEPVSELREVSRTPIVKESTAREFKVISRMPIIVVSSLDELENGDEDWLEDSWDLDEYEDEDDYEDDYEDEVEEEDEVVCTVKHKTCTRCGRRKAVKHFSKDRRHPNGLGSQCKDCKNGY